MTTEQKAYLNIEYKLAHLQTMPDAWLNENAAKLVMGFSQCPVNFFPTTDRNQSGELLAEMVKRGAQFDISLAFSEESEVGIYLMTNKGPWPEILLSGSSARSETLAAILAAMALKEKEQNP